MKNSEKKLACKLIRDIFKNKNKTKIPFTVTYDSVLYWWQLINHILFDGLLNKPAKFEFKAFHKSLGWCLPHRMKSKKRKVIIGIHKKIDNLYDFLCIMIHEMVHQWEYETSGLWDNNVQHTRRFFAWRQPIRVLLGAPLQTRYDIYF